MSIGSLGVIGSLTTGQLQQARGADTDRATQDATSQNGEIENARQAERAEGLGEMLQDEGAADRDADGRRMWERPVQKPKTESSPDEPAAESPHSLDPTGQAGANLDLLG